MKKKLAIVLALALVVALLAGCGSKAEDKKIKVGATPVPHAAVLEVAKELLAKQGYELEIVVYTDYVQPNMAVESGDLDANYFQHAPYMNDFNKDNGTHIVSAGLIHYEPFGLFPGKTASIDALGEGAQIAIPNDATNGARALLLLQQEGIITLKEGVGNNATVYDIVGNPKNIELKEMEAAQLPLSLSDVDMAVINGNYALDSGLDVHNALAHEDASGDAAQTYANLVGVKEGNENSAKIQALVKALQSQEVKDFMDKTYGVAVVPIF